jgi:hypothetical protein
MTRAEVEAVLGSPDGRMLEIDGTPVDNVMLVWKDRKVVIEFDEANRVLEVKSAPSMIDNLRAMLGF